MRLLVIVDAYVPARISEAIQMHDFARELVRQGHEPTVLVPAAGEVARSALESIDGVRVLRVATPKTRDVGLMRRAVAECLMPFATLYAYYRSALQAERWDGVIWYSPSIFHGPAVAWLKRRNRCRSYLILRDLFPDWAVDTGVMRRGAAYRFFKRVERYQYRVADVIGVQTPANVPLVARDCRPGTRIEVLNNWLEEPVRGETKLDIADTPLAGRKIFAYTGNMGAAQGMDCLLDLAAALRDEPEIGFLFVGRGTDLPRLRARAEAERLANVMFVNEVDSKEIPAILAQCHVGLIALDPRHTTHNIPGKLLTYLHAGLPVLARINAGNDLDALVREAGVGRVVVGDSMATLVAHARELAGDAAARAAMGARGKALVRQAYSPASVVAQVVRGIAA